MAERAGPSDGVRGSRARTRLDPEVRREQIIDAAERVLRRRDPSEVTFEQLAEAAGVSRGLVYNYFGDKGGVVAAVYLRHLLRLCQQLERSVSPASSSSERVRRVIDAYLRSAAADPAGWQFVATAEVTDRPEVQRARRRLYDNVATAWGGTADARLLARAIVGFLETATLEWLRSGGADLERATDVIHAQLWSGLRGLEDHDVRVGPA
jgi:AcrR family transcriptional regulator